MKPKINTSSTVTVSEHVASQRREDERYLEQVREQIAKFAQRLVKTKESVPANYSIEKKSSPKKDTADSKAKKKRARITQQTNHDARRLRKYRVRRTKVVGGRKTKRVSRKAQKDKSKKVKASIAAAKAKQTMAERHILALEHALWKEVVEAAAACAWATTQKVDPAKYFGGMRAGGVQSSSAAPDAS